MGFRTVVIKSRAKLDYKMDYLVVRTEEQVKRIHLDEIAVLMVESTAVSLTAYLIAEMIRKKIKVIFCDEKRNPVSELCSLHGAHDSSRKVREQINWQKDCKDFVWAEIVKFKIMGQISNLPEGAEGARALMTSYLNEIKPADATNREAHAAKVYFNALFGMEFSRAEAKFAQFEMASELTETFGQINHIMSQLSFASEFDIVFDYINDISSLMKLYRLRPDSSNLALTEKIVLYMELMRKYAQKQLFITVNLKSCLTDDEINSFYKDVLYRKLNLLCVENFDRGIFDAESKKVFDYDMCQI